MTSPLAHMLTLFQEEGEDESVATVSPLMTIVKTDHCSPAVSSVLPVAACSAHI